ncbi:Kelch repeat-containing protein [Gloeobacter morelensis]|nr:kelch repeat-containing protein [Gloeobacter morelensis]
MNQWMAAPLVAATVVLLGLSLARILNAQTDRIGVQINFQPTGSAVPADYLKDTGAAYSSSRGYGWVREDSLSASTATPLDVSANTRDRAVGGIDPRLNTLAHMEYPPDGAVSTPAAWEYALPNGSYSVQITVGDPVYFGSEHALNVEGVPALEGYRTTASRPFKQVLVEAQVSDGKLSVDGVGGLYTKINTVEIASRPGFESIGWSGAAASPIALSESQGGFAGGRLYVLGGYTDLDPLTATQRSYAYDPVADSWKQIADAPTSLTHAGMAVVGRDIYLAGGYIADNTSSGSQTFAVKDVWKYDTVANQWTAMPPLPAARGSGSLVMLGRELHFFGGNDANRVDKKDHWILKLDGGTAWSTAAPLPTAKSHMGAAALGGKIYAIGGQQGYGDSQVSQSAVHAWDPEAADRWSAVASLPQVTSHIGSATFAMENRIVVLGGQFDSSNTYNDTLAYDPLSNAWTSLTPLPVPRHSGVAGTHNGQIVYTAGQVRTQTYRGLPGEGSAADWLSAPGESRRHTPHR